MGVININQRASKGLLSDPRRSGWIRTLLPLISGNAGCNLSTAHLPAALAAPARSLLAPSSPLSHSQHYWMISMPPTHTPGGIVPPESPPPVHCPSNPPLPHQAHVVAHGGEIGAPLCACLPPARVGLVQPEWGGRPGREHTVRVLGLVGGCCMGWYVVCP